MTNNQYWLRPAVIYLFTYLGLSFFFSLLSGMLFVFLFAGLVKLAPFVFLLGASVGYLNSKNRIYAWGVKFVFLVFIILQFVLNIYSDDTINYENTKYRYLNPDIAVCVGECTTYQKSEFYDILTKLNFLKIKIL